MDGRSQQCLRGKVANCDGGKVALGDLTVLAERFFLQLLGEYGAVLYGSASDV